MSDWWNYERQIIRTHETKDYRVVSSVLPDPEPLDRDFNDGDSEVVEAYIEEQEKLETGEYVNLVIHVQVEHKATGLVLGQASMGGGVWESIADLLSTPGYLSMLASDAIAEARKTKQLLCSA